MARYNYIYKLMKPHSTRPRSSLVAVAMAVAMMLSTALSGNLAPVHAANLTSPSWWVNGANGTCDSANFPGSYSLATWNGVMACGPINTSRKMWFTGSSVPDYEWQCVELVARYMDMAFNIMPYWGDGKDMVIGYTGGLLMPIQYNQASPIASVPSPGDVISFNGTSLHPAGHTAIVTATSVDNSGTGSITLLQENSSGTATPTLTVTNWVIPSISDGFGGWMAPNGWLHNPTLSSTSDPSALYYGVSNSIQGNVEVFRRNGDGTTSHDWETSAGNPSAWSGWAGFGGSGLVNNLTTAFNSEGREEVFARASNNTIWHQWNSTSGWSGWVQLDSNQFASDPVVVHKPSGFEEIFARGLDNNLYHNWQTPGGTGWSGWAQLPTGGTWTNNPQVTLNSSGLLEIFARNYDTHIYHLWQVPSSPTGWYSGGWQSLGSTSFYNQPTVTTNRAGWEEVFARDINGNIWHDWQDPTSGTGWSSWTSLAQGSAFNGDTATARTDFGYEEIFEWRASDGTVWHMWQNGDPSTGGWSSWTQLSGVSSLSSLTTAKNYNVLTELFGRSSNGSIYHIYQDPNAPGGWSSWSAL